MDAIGVLRQQLKEAHDWMEGTMQGVTSQHLHWQPPGKANTLAACYIHVVMGEDWAINTLLKGGAPLAATTHAGKAGFSEPPPADPTVSWYEWGRRVKVDLPAMQKYAQAVYANSDKYLSTLKESELDQKIDTPLGAQTRLWLLSNVVIGHIHNFAGEISCLKGLQGLKGYPA